MQNEPDPSLPRAYGTREVAAALGTSERTIRRWIRAGVLPDRRPGGAQYRILEEDIGRLLWDRLIDKTRAKENQSAGARAKELR